MSGYLRFDLNMFLLLVYRLFNYVITQYCKFDVSNGIGKFILCTNTFYWDIIYCDNKLIVNVILKS